MGRAAATPKNLRLYAIGDIHGRLDLLTRLLAMVEEDAVAHPKKLKKLIFLGDYIDRGVDSKGVVQRLTEPFGAGLTPVFLRGNHDDRLIRFLDGELDVAMAWLELGGAATLASYGVNPFSGGKNDRFRHLHAELSKVFPAEHRAFLDKTEFSVSFGDYYFVHAGVKPGVLLEDQRPEDQMWIRGEFLNHPKGMGKMIVHGHTIADAPDVRPNRIGLDTGAFATGRLTCLVMDGEERSFLST